jgi:hypothetical protein
METLQTLISQLHFSLSVSQMIISLGIVALAAIWGRIRIGAYISLGICAYWVYAANKAVFFEMALANAYGLITTVFVAMFLGFLLFYSWVSPSSSR